MSLELRQYKNQQRRRWDLAAAGRATWRERVEPALAPLTAALLELAGIADGQWALDVACGSGEVTLAVARGVGDAGRVVGVDLAPQMVAAAEARARLEGVANTGFRVLDAATLLGWPEKSYDVAVSRFGLSFMADLDVVVRGIRHVLTPGGRFANATWGPAEAVPFLALARRAAEAVMGTPPPSPSSPGPGPFGLSRPGTLEQIMSSAGFTRIEGRPVTVVVELPSVAAYVELMRDATSLGATVKEGIESAETAAAVWRAVAEAATPLAGADGRLRFENQTFCVVGSRD